jgi:hypothetical protein
MTDELEELRKANGHLASSLGSLRSILDATRSALRVPPNADIVRHAREIHDAATTRIQRVRDMAAEKRLMFWKTHEQAQSDRYRTEMGLLAEAWGQVARDLDDALADQSEGNEP